MVDGSNTRKKIVTELEAGRPFSPAMFEGVLRKFTPDIPSSILSRPRSVLLTLSYWLPCPLRVFNQFNFYPMICSSRSQHAISYHKSSFVHDLECFNVFGCHVELH